jgi:phospholipid/cholesterol/gamma-HCH transport system substrate-binding protein
MSRAARIGAFIVATLAILVAGIFVIGSKQYLFSSTYQLKTKFDNVVGLDAGGDVRVGGVHSGTVRNIVLPHKPGDKVTVVMDLSKSTHEIIKQDSVASIETEGLLGNQYLAISFGCWCSQPTRRRYYSQPAASRNGRSTQENEWHSR